MMRAMRRFLPGMRRGGFLLALLALLGVLAGSFHHHSGIGVDDGCAACALSHAPADGPPGLDLPDPSVAVRERLVFTPAAEPESAPRVAESSRAPPLS